MDQELYFKLGAERLKRESFEQKGASTPRYEERFGWKFYPLTCSDNGRYEWPFASMDVGEYWDFHDYDAKRARLAAHTYAQQNGFCKFKTRSQTGGAIRIKRIE